MTRGKRPSADEAGRGKSIEETWTDGGGITLSQDAVSASTKGGRTPVYANTDARPSVRRVALVTMDHLDLDALCYALNACQRMDAYLDILTNIPPSETNQAVIAARGSTDTPWRVVRISSDCGDGVLRYASSESGLLFLASGAGDEKARRIRDKSGPNGMPLGISWVVVEGRRTRR